MVFVPTVVVCIKHKVLKSILKDNYLNLGLPVLDLRLKYGDSKIPIYMLMQSTGKEDCFHAEVSLSILHNP